jgi:hypothetical protein
MASKAASMKNNHDAEELYEQQIRIFDHLVEQIEAQLEKFGRPRPFGPGDYSIYEDYWGHPQVKVSMCSLKMLRPTVIEELQRVVKMYPGWEIVVAVVIRDHRDWPEMGLYVRPNEIIDGLRRQYFPKEFQNIRYPGARPGGVND